MILKIFCILIVAISQTTWVIAKESSGLIFECSASKLPNIKLEVKSYIQEIGIPESVYEVEQINHRLRFSLTHPSSYGTLYLRWNPSYAIAEERVSLPTAHGLKQIETVSKKEILLALMHEGRATIFKDNACEVSALKEHVEIRQMIVAWSEHLHWSFPDGSVAQWNPQYWERGNLRPGASLDEAMKDFFINPDQCSVGCYTATKIVIIQAVLDYFRRVKKNHVMADAIVKRLKSDHDVLVGIEPDAMWTLQKSINPEEQKRLGKLLKVQTSVASMNFVPGDWVYFVNNDKDSTQIDGYEGSNTIYMGRASFDDFYNDNHHHYLYNEKLSTIYNWRNRVFSRSRDYSRIEKLSAEQIYQLGLSTEEGGFLLNNRAVPYFFGFEPF
jgi:hypothetical protein